MPSGHDDDDGEDVGVIADEQEINRGNCNTRELNLAGKEEDEEKNEEMEGDSDDLNVAGLERKLEKIVEAKEKAIQDEDFSEARHLNQQEGKVRDKLKAIGEDAAKRIEELKRLRWKNGDSRLKDKDEEERDEDEEEEVEEEEDGGDDEDEEDEEEGEGEEDAGERSPSAREKEEDENDDNKAHLEQRRRPKVQKTNQSSKPNPLFRKRGKLTEEEMMELMDELEQSVPADVSKIQKEPREKAWVEGLPSPTRQDDKHQQKRRAKMREKQRARAKKRERAMVERRAQQMQRARAKRSAEPWSEQARRERAERERPRQRKR